MSDYQVTLSTADIQECARFMVKFMRKRQKKGYEDQQCFFILLSAFMAANAEGMMNSGYPEDEVRSVFKQASDLGIRMREFKVVTN